MAKRIAEKELTDRNWDQEDEAEAVGTFSVASEEVLKNRAIKKAKRRNVGFEPDGGGAFKGFKGLVVPSGGGAFSGFGGAAGGKPLEGLANGSSVGGTPALPGPRAAADPKAALGAPAANGPASSADKETSSPKANGGDPRPCPPGPAPPGGAYHKQLAALNCSVRDWIAKHVNSNPLCDLTPIFQDYGRYLAAIEQQRGASERGAGQGAAGAPAPVLFGAAKAQPEATFLLRGDKTEQTSEQKTEAACGEETAAPRFGGKVDGAASGPPSAGPLTAFSFSSGNSSLFGKDTAQSKSAAAPFASSAVESQAEGGGEGRGGDDGEDSEPPEVVVTEVKEEDAFYSKKCKLFYKKDSEFKEKGVGTLHLKPTASQKTQLLVRADTNLGNILLNVLVPPNMPCSRAGKNNVLIVCAPNPPVDPGKAAAPVPMLLRVKTSEDADELHRLLLGRREDA